MKLTFHTAAVIAISGSLAYACSTSPTSTAPTSPGASTSSSSVTPTQKPDSRTQAKRTGNAPKVEWTQAELEDLARTIQAQVADLRGASFERPVAVRLADKDKFFEYAQERQSLTETPEKMEGDQTIAKLLGTFPPELDLAATMMEFLKEQVGGFYDPASNSFSLMDQCPKGVAKIVLAHELGHALDDQLYSLDARMTELAKNSDASFAYAAVVEGSGTAVMTRWTLAHMSEVGTDMAGLAEMQEDANESMAKAPMWLWKPLIAVYLQGASFLARSSSLLAGQSGGATNEDIDAAFKNPPRSMEQVLHPEKYWNEEKRDEPLYVAFDATKLEDGWSVQREDTLGEFFLAILATPPAQRTSPDLTNPMAILGMKFTNDVGRGWGGDRVALLGKGKARYLRLVTRWDTPRDAAEFLGAMTMLVPDLERSAKAFAEHLGAPDAEEAELKLESGAEVEYGKDEAVVTLSIWSRVPSRDRKMIEKRLGVTFDPK